MTTATLGGGCFWCLEAVFQRLQGVTAVTSGYAGGTTVDPDYRSVCSGTTGHAEVVRIEFDPLLIDFETLLEVFFTIHDPTTPNRQGADVGTQYRSIILWETEDQRASANAIIERLTREGAFANPIVTEVTPLTTFYPAESSHQDYYNSAPNQPYCQVVILPKLLKAQDKHPERWRGD
ncbi:peptide-methionine (S)-S-oxide reductase MsrA [Spiribacter sp. C176]|uniref:Peptide methionine sulfoxide reductase MsrA n=1 Tax=Spiribacter salilacus TaxID=2664894 RepID=A0A6N7QQJ4_9GAMM|nr:peptide-methionine (S)-S-oxide reductase MsrA [Spiribacter salilacus]MRH77970.1 peptide-methionine (S)-S-oxide reductase MsrA [Spiribacter salilacus]